MQENYHFSGYSPKKFWHLSEGPKSIVVRWVYEQILLHFIYTYILMEVKGDWDFWISDLVKNPDGTDI